MAGLAEFSRKNSKKHADLECLTRYTRFHQIPPNAHNSKTKTLIFLPPETSSTPPSSSAKSRSSTPLHHLLNLDPYSSKSSDHHPLSALLDPSRTATSYRLNRDPNQSKSSTLYHRRTISVHLSRLHPTLNSFLLTGSYNPLLSSSKKTLKLLYGTSVYLIQG
ncbi:hypothetical protein R6Q59_030918 [Mikania micrantha]